MRIFVGNLPFDSTDQDFKATLADLNLVPDKICVMRDRDTNACRGFAFLDFRTDQLGQLAIDTLSFAFVGSRQLRASVAQDRPGYRPGNGNAGGRPGTRNAGSMGRGGPSNGQGGHDQKPSRDEGGKGRKGKGRGRESYDW